MRKVFFRTLADLARKNKDIFIITADLGVKFIGDFKDLGSGRFVNVGIAESNMIGVAAGLAMSGKNVYCYSMIPFLIMRPFEQIRVDLCYNNLNVKLLGAGGGLIYGLEGVTHHAIEDIGALRSIPNMTIVAPGDVLEAEALAKESVGHQGPLYIRFARDADPMVHDSSKFDFKIGKGITVNQGRDVCLIATGSMLYPAKTVLENLKKKGISTTLISMHTIKPLDRDIIEDCLKRHSAIFTIEEHNIIGGLGSAVSEVLSENSYHGLFRRIGIPDKYCSDIGGVDYLRAKFGLSEESITEYILKNIKREAQKESIKRETTASTVRVRNRPACPT